MGGQKRDSAAYRLALALNSAKMWPTWQPINWRLGCLLPQTIRDHQKMVKIKQRIAELEAAQNETN